MRLRLEPAAVTGILSREWTMFGRYWKATTFSSIVEPLVNLIAFGLGFGALVSTVGGLDYVQYVGTGTVATAVLFSSVFPAMFVSFIRRRFQRTYDALLAAPVDTEEIVTAEALWLALRAGVYGCAPLLVSIAFGLDPAWGMFLVPFFGFVCGFGFALGGLAISGAAKSIDNFNYITSAVLTPILLLAGSFFPINGLPAGIAFVAHVNPLYHLVQLTRHAVLGLHPLADLGHLGVLLLFVAITWPLAVWMQRRQLID